jgi:hypothetical protein
MTNESFRAVANDCDSRILIMIINNLFSMASKRNRFYVAMSNLEARRSNVSIDYVNVFFERYKKRTAKYSTF